MPRHDETELAEALRLSEQRGAALQLDQDDEEDGYLPASPPYALHDEDHDPDVADLNNPDVDTFGEPPLLGTRTPPTEMFGDSAETIGRATSPKLYAQAAQFPSAVQYRVWRWENGIPVAIGAIDAEASEDDFVRKFYNAMPKVGDGKYQFRFRPVDIRGRELGKEFTINISEHHAEVQSMNRQRDRQREERGVQEPILINQGGGDGGAYAEEMGRMFEQAVESAERRTELLQATLEDERDRLRVEEKSRYQERIAVADRSADVVQKMTERLMETDKARSKEQLEAQKGHSNMLIQTLTTVFSQQQTAAATQAERLRQTDEARSKQDRAYFDRQRSDTEESRKSDAQEWERKRVQEREEADRRATRDGAEADRRLQGEKERLELERTRIGEQRKFELEQLRVESERRQHEADRRREQEREGSRLHLERERMELERKEKLAREERDRWQVQLEEKRRTDREDWDRKMVQQREDAERRERADRERTERERQDFQLRMEREREEREAAANRRGDQSRRDEERRKEEGRRTEENRKAEMELKLKQMEIESQRAREHQEKMAEQGRLDREARQEAQTRRDSLEREARESQDRDRQRQHEFLLRQMELERENAREHQERMMAGQGGGESPSLFGTIGDQLGLEPSELLAKLFGKDGEDGSWADAIPKVLGSIAELGKAAITAKAEQQQQQQVKGRRKLHSKQQGQIVQTPQGPMMVLPRSAQAIPDGPPPVQPLSRGMDLPDKPFPPPAFSERDEDLREEPLEPEPQASRPKARRPEVNTLGRAKGAGIRLVDQKKARKAIRALGERLMGAEEDEWLGLVTQAITDEVGIYYYMRAVTVDAALREASHDLELRDQVVQAMRGSGLIPEDVPYTEEDYDRLQSMKKEASNV